MLAPPSGIIRSPQQQAAHRGPNRVFGGIAQVVEHRPFKPLVLGSSPSAPINTVEFICRGHHVMKTLTLASWTALLLVSSPDVYAHHSHANLDRTNVQQHTGVVTQYSWRMPHAFLEVQGPNQAGELVNWTIELLHPAGMIQWGWSQDSFTPGDRITWDGAMDKNPDRHYSGLLWAEKADGTRLYNVGSGHTLVEAPVEPSTDFTGLWVRDRRVGFHYVPPADWPYSDHAKALVASFDETQNPQLDCENPGPPKSTFLPYPIKISRPDQGVIVLDYEMRDQRRVFRLGQAVMPAVPSKTGQSRAWMEGNELVVETSSFIADRWGSHTGVDSSDRKHLLERFSLIEDGLTLRIRMTLTDPVYLTRPVEIDYYMRKVADRELLPANCTLESARLFVEAGFE